MTLFIGLPTSPILHPATVHRLSTKHPPDKFPNPHQPMYSPISNLPNSSSYPVSYLFPIPQPHMWMCSMTSSLAFFPEDLVNKILESLYFVMTSSDYDYFVTKLNTSSPLNTTTFLETYPFIGSEAFKQKTSM